jgi:hypothetical protein
MESVYWAVRFETLNIIQNNLIHYRVPMYYTVLTKGMKYKHSETHLVNSLTFFLARSQYYET